MLWIIDHYQKRDKAGDLENSDKVNFNRMSDEVYRLVSPPKKRRQNLKDLPAWRHGESESVVERVCEWIDGENYLDKAHGLYSLSWFYGVQCGELCS